MRRWPTSGEFAKLYAPIGRPSIPPEERLRALLLRAFSSVRSERQLIAQLQYNLLFGWFTGLALDEPVWDVTVFIKNRDRLLDGEIAACRRPQRRARLPRRAAQQGDARLNHTCREIYEDPFLFSGLVRAGVGSIRVLAWRA
jgi:Transposase domain (DUF772)